MPHPTPTPVRRAGPFDLIEPILLPGSGTWWRAERVTYSRGANSVLVCIAADPHARDRLRSAHAALLEHEDPRLPRVVGWYEGAGALAVTATAGISLASILPLRKAEAVAMTPATLLDIGVELCEVLVSLHDAGRAHGALIPHHITLSDRGHVVVWGLGETLSTPSDWRAPDRGPGSMASDQWQLGATLAALVTGAPPWPSEGSRSKECHCADALGTQWPALSRVIARLTARNPSHRYPSMSVVRRELLRLARRATSPSQRRELGALLHTSPSPTATRSPMAKPPRIQLPLPSTATPATDVYEAQTPRISTPRTRAPQESVPVVRPTVGDYVPTASVSAKASAFANVEINPSTPNNNIPVVAVEFDDTDQGLPQPIGMSMATDDMPVPTPEDVFGGLEIADGDPLEAPTAQAAIAPPVPELRPSPQPALGLHSGPTAVPATDPGFGTVSLDLDGEADSFFSDAAAGVQGIDNLPVNPRRDGPREPSPVERVAHGMVIANAALFALWFVVRVF